jgi:hypothetical protein
MSSDAGISSHISESSAQDAFSALAPPLASPPAQAPLLMAGEVEKDTLEDEDALLGGLEIVPPSAFWTENKLASFGINNRLLKCKSPFIYFARELPPRSRLNTYPLHVSVA